VILPECTGISRGASAAKRSDKAHPVLVHTGTSSTKIKATMAVHVHRYAQSDPQQLLTSLEQIEDLDSEAVPAL